MKWPLCLPLIALGLAAGCQRKQTGAPGGPDQPATTNAVTPPSRPELTVLYSSDLQGRFLPDTPGASGGLARRATIVDRIRLEGGPIVQLDAGDLLPGAADAVPNAAYERERRTDMVLTSYARMGVNVVTPGERDLELGPEGFKAAFKAAKLSVVAANLRDQNGAPPFPADQLITVGKHTIGVFGILDLPPGRAADLKRWGFRLVDGADAAREAARSLRARGAWIIVGLFHVDGGLARVKEILSRAGDVDAVILGHGGHGLAAGTATTVGRTRIVRTAPLGTALGRLDVRDRAPDGRPAIEDRTVALTNGVPEHFGVALIERAEVARIQAAEEQAAAALRRKKGQKEPQVFETWTYASNSACALCHAAEEAQWNTTDHAHALATLSKVQHQNDPACLGCHTTGYLQPGGTRNFETLNKYFANVSCESCHGPSAEHVRSPDKKKGTLRRVGPEVCLGCHTSDRNIGYFDHVAALKSVLGPGHGVARTGSP